MPDAIDRVKAARKREQEARTAGIATFFITAALFGAVVVGAWFAADGSPFAAPPTTTVTTRTPIAASPLSATNKSQGAGATGNGSASATSPATATAAGSAPTSPSGVLTRAKTVTTVERGGNTVRALRAGAALVGSAIGVLLAAFIAGALVQRMWQGRFDVRLGALGLEAAVREGDVNLDLVAEAVVALSERLQDARNEDREYDERVDAQLARLERLLLRPKRRVTQPPAAADDPDTEG